MAIALAHGGKTREELAKELASIDGGGERWFSATGFDYNAA